MKKIKRFKIVEQIGIVTLFSVLAPMIIAGLIVNNINQHAIRKELNYSAQIIAQTIDNNINSLLESDEGKLKEVVLAIKYIPSEYIQGVYLKDVMINSNIYRNLEIVQPSLVEIPDIKDGVLNYLPKFNTIKIFEKIHDDKYLAATIDVNILASKVFNNLKNDKRRIYVIDENKNVVLAHNFSHNDFQKVLKLLPNKLEKDKPVIFGNVKNQPLAYLKMTDKNLTVIVNTTEEITEKTINTARAKIILSILIAVGFIFFLVGIYTYYLYINIRQLFKGVMALSKGNYKRQIRLLTNVFTPYEIFFLATEFNKMVNEINVSYKQLKHKNRELKLLDEFRSNLVDTVSHEFRTPLTSIKGYTSRLLRQDIVIDDETKHKSLIIIKQQCERLSRMVEDLLVIPDIEGAKLNIKLERVNVSNEIGFALMSIKNIEKREIINNVSSEFPYIKADKDRFEQVVINLIENAVKYAYDGTPITIEARTDNKKAIISISNKADYIEKDVLEKLFEKFTRVEYETTRTTRGTGLGLFIVKGLVRAMNGSIYLKSSINNEFNAQIILPLYDEEV